MANGSVAVEVDGLRKTYGEVVAVDDVGFTVAEGEVLAILGPNGAGKTTTVEAVAGLRRSDAGRIRVHGVDPWADRDATTRLVGVQLQESRLQPKLTAGEALRLWSALYDEPRSWQELAKRLDLADLLDRRFTALSGGQQQRLAIALALIGRPRVAILDELSTGLDPQARRKVWQLIRELRDEGTTILLVTHAMEEAQQLADRVAIIDRGRVRALGTPDELIGGAAAATVVSFVASRPVDLTMLRQVAGVAAVRAGSSEASRLEVEGAEDVALAVLAHLSQNNVVPHGLRISDGSLDTAYLDLLRDTNYEPADDPVGEPAGQGASERAGQEEGGLA